MKPDNPGGDSRIIRRVWIGISLIAFAAIYFLAAVLHRRWVRREFSWLQVPGTIVVSTVTFNCFPDVQYWFVYEGRRYYGLRLHSAGFAFGTSGWARRLAGQFPAGAAVKVYVNPEEPQESVLIPGGDRRSVVSAAIFAAFFLYVGVQFLFI